MKATINILAILTGIMLFSTLVCGLWIRYSGEVIEDSSITFHLSIGVVAVLFAAATLVLAVVQVNRLIA